MAVSQMESLQQQLEDIRRDLLDLRNNRGERVIIMIDRSNLDQTWRRVDTNNMRPDYVKLTQLLSEGRTQRQVRVYYSDIDVDMVKDEERADWQRRQDFYNFLRHQGWVLRGVKKKFYDGMPVEKGLDGALIRDMDMICRDNRCDTVILVAGDADYCDVVADVQDRYCARVEVAFFPNQTARDLQFRASKFTNLEYCMDRIVRRPTY